jgi:methionyl-tRNA formyltransferase
VKSSVPERLRVAFAGTPEFARAALARVHTAAFDVALVLTQPDRPAGRGMKLQPSPVKSFAVANGLPIIQPRGLRLDGKFADDAQAARRALEEARPDAIVVAAYGLILPLWVLSLPRLGCLNIHASLLPRWRGAAPIHRAIEAGDTHTGITIMQMDAGLDTGDMLMSERIPIPRDDTTATLQGRLASLGAELIVKALQAASGGAPVRTPQPVEGVSYAHKVEKAEAAIDWTLPAEVIERRVRAFDPFPGATFVLNDEPIKLWKSAVRPEVSAAPGSVIAADGERLIIACGRGALELLELQRPGGKRISTRQFLQATAQN